MMSVGTVRRPLRQLLARDQLLLEVTHLLNRGHNVLLHGPAQIGKSAIIAALPHDCVGRVTIVDPFERITPHVAADIRRSMDLRGQQYLAASRSLDRRQLGAVRRIAWRFTTVPIPPLSNHVLQAVIVETALDVGVVGDAMNRDLVRRMAALCRGRVGLAIAMAQFSAERRHRTGQWPSAGVAYIEARSEEWCRDRLTT